MRRRLMRVSSPHYRAARRIVTHGIEADLRGHAIPACAHSRVAGAGGADERTVGCARHIARGLARAADPGFEPALARANQEILDAIAETELVLDNGDLVFLQRHRTEELPDDG